MIPSVLPLALLSLIPLASASSGHIKDTPQWTNLASLPFKQQEHTTVVVNESTIALVGGVGFIGNSSMQTGFQTTNRVQLYDIPTDTWRQGAPLPVNINHPNVAMVDGKLYLLGGLVDRSNPPLPVADWQASGECHVYDPSSNTWTELMPMPPGTERGSAVVGVHEEMIYLAGGMTILATTLQDSLITVTAFNTTSRKWQRVTPNAANIPEGRQHGVGAVYKNVFYIIGGRWFEKANVRDTVFKLDLTDLEAGWKTSTSMPTARGSICGAVVDGSFYVFGGEGNTGSKNGIFDNVEVFNLETEEWTKLGPMPVPRHGTSAVSIRNRIYIPGGGLQGDGVRLEYPDGLIRILNTTTHFDALVV